MWQIKTIIIDHGKSGQIGKVEGQSDRDFSDSIVSNINDLEAGEL